MPELDLLDDSAVGNRGARSRREIDLQAGEFGRALGVRLTGGYRSGTRVDAFGSGGASSVGDPTSGGFSTFDLPLFADLGA